MRAAHLARRALSGGLLAFAIASCAELFEEPVQCRTNDDCARFEDAVCGDRGVCITKTRGEDDDAGPRDPDPIDASGDTGTSRCSAAGKTPSPIGTRIGIGTDGTPRAEIAAAVTLGCDKDWTLDGLVLVRAGATLTIEAGTTIKAKKGTGAGLVVLPGARLVAEGQRDLPIVFTSDTQPATAGDWRGIFLLGRAPRSGTDPFDADPELPYGGADENDDSGVLSFVRIEYPRSGLVLGALGKKTKIDFVQVRQTLDNCFGFFGGRVDAKHLVCQAPGDDQFEWYLGYAGRVQFLFGQKSPAPPVFDANGILVDEAHPVIFNATICGDNPTPNGDGVVFRDFATLDLSGAVVSGWFAGIDATGELPEPGNIRSSILFANQTNPAFDEDQGQPDPEQPDFDDDFGFDELGWFADPTQANLATDPRLVACLDAKAPKPWPATSLTANAPAPPADGFFDVNARYVGAFKDATDTWMTGAWVRFDDK